MSRLSEIAVRSDTCPQAFRNYRTLRISCWLAALTLGAAQAWATRFTMNPDGVSYLDIGDAYWRGDWRNAINGYWSPLYSWILGFVLRALRPSPSWEYPLAHLVNFLTYVFTLGCFEFFLVTFVREERTTERQADQTETPFPQYSWWLLGYSLFLSTSILMIGLALVTPDMCVAGVVYLASALVLRIRSGAGRQVYFMLGVVLGFAYLAKAVMLPVGFVFLVASFYKNSSRNSLKYVAISLALLLGVSSPFVAGLSITKRHLTFGEVGPIAYEVFVDGVDQFIPTQVETVHPVHKLLETPPTYEFSQPVGGTFPLWYDPTYWHAGLKPHWNFAGQGRAVGLALLLYFWILITFQLNLLVPFLALLLIATQPSSCWRRMFGCWPLVLPAVTAMALYSLVYVEPRYLGPFLLLFWIAGFSGLRFPGSRSMRKFLGFASGAIAVTTILFAGNFVIHQIIAGETMGPVYWRAARALRTDGLLPNEKIGLIWNEKSYARAVEGTYVPRLLRLRIVAEATDANTFWTLDNEGQERVLRAMGRAGIRAVLAYRVPTPYPAGWQRLDTTEYFVYRM